MSKKFWEFKNVLNNESADLYIYNEIVSWEDEDFTSAQSFRDDLEGIGEVKNINLYINSPGGSVSDGLAIASMLKRSKSFVTAQVDGLACSIASVIACSADKVVMRNNCMMMIHNALAGGFMYDNAKGYRKLADDLDKISSSLRMTYIEKSGGKITEEKLTELMDSESWLTAKECLDLGLCDEIITGNKAVASISNKFKGVFNKIPTDVEVIEDTQEEVIQEEVPVEEEVSDEVVDEVTTDVVVEDEASETNSEEIVEEEQENQEIVDEVKPEDNLVDKLENATNEIIRLNEVIENLQEIADKYNEIQAKEEEIKDKKEFEAKVEFYKNKFDNLGASDKFETEEVQVLLKNCIKDKEALLTLNLMVVDLIDTNKLKNNNVVKRPITEKISKVENLIPTTLSVEEKYGFK